MQRFLPALAGILIPVSAILWICPGCGEDSGQPTAPGGGLPTVTVDTIPPAGILSLQCKSPGAGSLALQWVSPGDDEWSGTAAAYDIRYSKSPIDDDNWDSAGRYTDAPVPLEAGTVQVCRVIALDANTEYWFRAKTRDESDNESGLSNLASGTTLQELMPPSQISDLKATAINDTTFLLTWTAPGDDGRHAGTASLYDVRYSFLQGITTSNWPNAQNVDGEPPPKPAGEPESLFVVVDRPDGNYGFAVKTADEVPNWSGISNVCLALGENSYLWAFPMEVHLGRELVINFRAPGGDRVRIEMHRLFAGYDCGSHQYTLYDDRPTAGTYTITYDFYDDEAGEYLRFDYYHIYVCVNRQEMGYYRIEFMP